MKKILTICAALALCGAAIAELPTYKSFTASGNATAGATVNIPSNPNGQIRVVSVMYSADTNNAALQLSSGEGAYVVARTNVGSTWQTNILATTAGLVTNSVLMLEHLGTCYTATLIATNNGTNAILDVGGWGVATSVGDSVYQMGTATSLTVGNTTNWLNGVAIYVGNYGRPVRAVLTPALATNKLNSLSVHYDGQSQ